MGDPDTDFLKVKSTLNYGLLTDIAIWRTIEGEFVWTRQPTSLTTHNPTDGTYTFLSKMNLDSYLFGANFDFRPKAKLRPFAGLLVGFSHFGAPPINGQPVLGFTNRGAFSFSGGAKYFFTKNLGIRMEGRWTPSETTYKGTGTCYENLFPVSCSIYNYAYQLQANLGMIFQF